MENAISKWVERGNDHLSKAQEYIEAADFPRAAVRLDYAFNVACHLAEIGGGDEGQALYKAQGKLRREHARARAAFAASLSPLEYLDFTGADPTGFSQARNKAGQWVLTYTTGKPEKPFGTVERLFNGYPFYVENGESTPHGATITFGKLRKFFLG